jgi:hypothetical protein
LERNHRIQEMKEVLGVNIIEDARRPPLVKKKMEQ